MAFVDAFSRGPGPCVGDGCCSDCYEAPADDWVERYEARRARAAAARALLESVVTVRVGAGESAERVAS